MKLILKELGLLIKTIPEEEKKHVEVHDSTELEVKETEIKTSDWFSSPHADKYIGGYCDPTGSGLYRFHTLDEAMEAAKGLEECAGITEEKEGIFLEGGAFTLRYGPDLENSPCGEVSWIRRGVPVPPGSGGIFVENTAGTFSYSQAKEYAASIGARLPTVDEVEIYLKGT